MSGCPPFGRLLPVEGVGEGPLDLVVVPGWISNVEFAWEDPGYGEWTRQLAAAGSERAAVLGTYALEGIPGSWRLFRVA